MSQPTEINCSHCAGEGKVADSRDQEPWSYWQNLPHGADLAVRMGIVNPMTCPLCNGTGKMTARKGNQADRSTSTDTDA